MPGLLGFADFEKAPDSISHKYIKKCLESFNFGTDIIKWAKCFTRKQIAVCKMQVLCPFFSISRGVRQECPLSPYLFILCIEILSAALLKYTRGL